MADEVKMELAFMGGGSAALTADSEQWSQLQAALSDGGSSGWTTLTSKDGATVLVNLDNVVFVKALAQSRQIGFAGAG